MLYNKRPIKSRFSVHSENNFFISVYCHSTFISYVWSVTHIFTVIFNVKVILKNATFAIPACYKGQRHGVRHALRLKRKKRWGVRRLCVWIKGPVTASGQRYRANLELKT